MINTLHVGKLCVNLKPPTTIKILKFMLEKYHMFFMQVNLFLLKALLYFCSVFGPTTSYIYTKQQLKPYKEYDFRIKATNSHGSTYSPWVMLVTLQDSESNYHMVLKFGCL